jgi:hypothetical protein
MQEVRVTIPEDQGPQVVEVAFQVGIEDVSVYRVEAPGAKARHVIVSAARSPPRRRRRLWTPSSRRLSMTRRRLASCAARYWS